MKFFHLADLHIGKTVNGYSMLKDQQYVFEQVLKMAEEEKPDVVLLAGDIYDRSVPSAEGVAVYDEFLTALVKTQVPTIAIAGNHDSPERLAFAGRIMQASGVHIAGKYQGELQKVTFSDNYGDVVFHLLPFVRPAHVRGYFPDDTINTYHQAVEAVLKANELDKSKRNVLIAHQFVVASGMMPERSDSETDPAGGIYRVDAKLFDDFDYVALGHLHRPQSMGRKEVRYAGSPLKYSFSEYNHHKSVTVVEMHEKGELEIRELPLKPLRDLRKIKGPIKELMSEAIVKGQNAHDYLHITLTDEKEVVDAIGKLRRHYPNVMELAFDNIRTRADASFTERLHLDDKTPQQLFEDFYKKQNGQRPDKSQLTLVGKMLGKLEAIL